MGLNWKGGMQAGLTGLSKVMYKKAENIWEEEAKEADFMRQQNLEAIRESNAQKRMLAGQQFEMSMKDKEIASKKATIAEERKYQEGLTEQELGRKLSQWSTPEGERFTEAQIKERGGTEGLVTLPQATIALEEAAAMQKLDTKLKQEEKLLERKIDKGWEVFPDKDIFTKEEYALMVRTDAIKAEGAKPPSKELLAKALSDIDERWTAMVTDETDEYKMAIKEFGKNPEAAWKKDQKNKWAIAMASGTDIGSVNARLSTTLQQRAELQAEVDTRGYDAVYKEAKDSGKFSEPALKKLFKGITKSPGTGGGLSGEPPPPAKPFGRPKPSPGFFGKPDVGLTEDEDLFGM